MQSKNLDLIMQKENWFIHIILGQKSFHIIYRYKRCEEKIKIRWQWNSVYDVLIILQSHSGSAYSMGLEPASVHSSVCAFTLSNSETGWPIIIKFHLKHHWGGGLDALGFGPDRIRTLVSMATDSSHRVIMGKTL